MPPRFVQLDPRLSTVYQLYEDCDLAADIGTDHAHLPAALLQRGRCQHMILTDVSPDALNNARCEINRCGLADRADLRLGDGLSPLKACETCRVISITGMGGRTIREILLSGHEKLHGASLILSAHTDWHLIRQALHQIGYHPDAEEPCFDNGRYYLVIRAVPGTGNPNPLELRLGGQLFRSGSPVLVPFLMRRLEILNIQLSGLLAAAVPDDSAIVQLKADIDYLNGMIEQLR